MVTLIPPPPVVTSYLLFEMLYQLHRISHSIILSVMYRGFMLSFQVTRRRADRTTFACNTHCCLVGQLYIEYSIYSIFNGSNFVTILPPLKIHVIPLACFVISGYNFLTQARAILFRMQSYPYVVVCVNSHHRHLKLYWLQLCCYLSLITTVEYSITS